MPKHLQLVEALKGHGFLKFPYSKGTRTIGGFEYYVDKRKVGRHAKFTILCDSEDAIELVRDIIAEVVPEARIERPGYTHGGPEVALLNVTFME